MEGSVNLSRRAFLRAQPVVRTALRPPWAVVEEAFVNLCSRCDECLSVCPNGIVVRGDGAYPTINFLQGECTFCGACADQCRTGALQRGDPHNVRPWPYRVQIAEACLAQRNVVCRTCGDVCEAGAIRFQPRLGGAAVPVVDYSLCSGCGACVSPCPTHAIAMTNHQEGAMQ